MARILLVTLCLTFICVPNIIAVIWGDVGEKFEANMLADLEEDGETELEKTVVETKVLEDHTRPYFIQGRAAVAPPVRPVATTPARPGVVAVPTITTITYKLGKRIPGKCHLLSAKNRSTEWTDILSRTGFSFFRRSLVDFSHTNATMASRSKCNAKPIISKSWSGFGHHIYRNSRGSGRKSAIDSYNSTFINLPLWKWTLHP